MQIEENDQVLQSKEQLLARIATMMGGRAAEEVVQSRMTTGAANDIEQATKLARAMVTRYGMSDDFGMMALETGGNAYLGGDASLLVSTDTAARIDANVHQIIDHSYSEAVRLLTEHKDQLLRLSDHLYEKETMTGEEFMNLLGDFAGKKPEGQEPQPSGNAPIPPAPDAEAGDQ